MEKPVIHNRIFRDKEIVSFYWIEVGLLGFVLILGLVKGELSMNLIIMLFILGFLYFGWPLTCELTSDGNVIFKNPLRRTAVTPKSIATVKAKGVHDYRAHITIRNKGGIPIGYRCRKYENAPILAQAVLELIEKASNARVTKDALKLLQRTAKGKTRPIPG